MRQQILHASHGVAIETACNDTSERWEHLPVDIQGKPMAGDPTANAHANKGNFAGSPGNPDPMMITASLAGDAKVAQAPNHNLLEQGNVPPQVTAISSQVHNSVTSDLTRSVVSNFAAALRTNNCAARFLQRRTEVTRACSRP